jgi:hypothetical protein
MRGRSRFLLAVVVTACAPRKAEAPAIQTAVEVAEPASAPQVAPPAAPPAAPLVHVDPKELRAITDRYATPALTADIAGLAAEEQAALQEIIAAARELDAVFDRQVWAGNAAAYAQATPEERRFLNLMRGPWDRQNEARPVLTVLAHPKGAGFYPEDMSADELEAHVAAHPAERAAFESLFTMIVRTDGKLSAVPYGKFFAAELTRAGDHLRKAAQLTKNASLQSFLDSRAAAFLSDDYYQSDKDWMDLDSAVEVTIGPYETYEDELFGLKASFEAFVTVSDPKASARLDKFKAYLPALEANLPIPKEMHAKRGGESPIRVVDLVYTSGDAKRSVQTIAFNLPNDERVRKEKGAKKVMLRNAIETKFEQILRPIAERTLASSLQKHLSAEAFFQSVLFHELSHSLGPAFVENDESKGESRKALGATYSAIEECKADVAGVYNILFLIQKKEFPAAFRQQLLASSFAGLLRSVRFGIGEAHGQGAAVQINRYLEAGAATWDAKTQRFSLDFARLEGANKALLTDLLTLEHHGDPQAAAAFLEKYGVMSAAMNEALAHITEVPIDIRPVFPLAGERGDPLALPH